jgi:hypothetical protein
LVVSPLKAKLICCPVALVTLEEPTPPEGEERSNIQGTATCFPAVEELEEGMPPDVREDDPGLEPPPSEMTAKSMRPDAGLMITSLIVPISLPEEPVTCAPVS